MARFDDSPVTRPMVHWYSPVQLLRTCADILSSTIVVRILDPRPLKRDGQPPASMIDWRGREEAWFDWVADTGDGWNSTFSVARAVASEELALSDPARSEHVTRRGDALVLGGDLVYPTPRGESYSERLEAPFREALAKAPAPEPIVLAIPGNHDWYDGLRAFTSRFCRPNVFFAAWRVKQSRSYFAIALPGDWWVVAIDVQLGEELDDEQIRYFQMVQAEMGENSRLALLLPRPDWMHFRPTHDETRSSPSDQIERVFGRKPDVRISGDLHHYRRFATIPKPGDSARTLITCGGGGAFMHPTDAPLDVRVRNRVEVRASFPPPEESRRYRKQLLAFPFHNVSFGLVPAVLYTLLALAGLSPGESGFDVARHFFANLVNLPGALALLAFVVPTLLFHQRGDVLSRLLAFGHACAQLAALIGTCVVASAFAAKWLPSESRDAATPLLVGLAGWWVGSFLVGVYLWFSAVCGRLLDVAYASLRIEDWKSFLRIRASAGGTLTVFPIGICRVARTWRRRVRESGETWLEPEGRATRPELIEMPIEIRR